MGGTKVKMPEPSAEERATQQEQLDLLRQQRAETEAFKPFLYESMGVRNVGGKLEKIPWAERLAAMNPQEKAQYDLASKYLDIQNKAASGELPVSPALERELEMKRNALAGNLSVQLGPNWQASTSGSTAMNEFDKRAGLMREEARRGMMTTGESLIGARMGLMQGQQQQGYGQMSNWNLPQYSGLMGGYSQAMQPFQFNRNMQYQANQQTAANRMGLISGAIGAGGAFAGSAFGLGGRWGQKI